MCRKCQTPGGLSEERTRPGSSTRHSRRSDQQRERERSACAALPRAMRVPLERSPFSRLADRLPADVESKSSRTLDAIIVVAQGPRYHSLIGIPGGTRRGFPSVLAYLRAFHPKVAPRPMGYWLGQAQQEPLDDLQRYRWRESTAPRLAKTCHCHGAGSHRNGDTRMTGLLRNRGQVPMTRERTDSDLRGCAGLSTPSPTGALYRSQQPGARADQPAASS